MSAHKLVLDDIVDPYFNLIAIHSSIEEYKLAFLLNKNLNLRLSRTRNDIDLQVNSIRALFSLYKFQDHKNYRDFYLISNKFKLRSKTTTGFGSLFGEEEMFCNTIHFLPEFRKVDFFLKIEQESTTAGEKHLLNKIKEIPQIAGAYTINENQLKTKENLIFD